MFYERNRGVIDSDRRRKRKSLGEFKRGGAFFERFRVGTSEDLHNSTFGNVEIHLPFGAPAKDMENGGLKVSKRVTKCNKIIGEEERM